MVGRASDKKHAARRAKMLYDIASKLSPEFREMLKKMMLDEENLIKENLESLKRLTGLGEIRVYRADDPEAPDMGGKKRQALPFKPAIYME